MKKRLALAFLGLLVIFSAVAQDLPSLEKASINLNDKASLQRGAKIFVNYCQGCHSLEYVRFGDLARGIGITDPKGKVLEKIVQENLIFTGEPITATIRTALSRDDAARWFGVIPPDLTLSARVRGADWLYTYLQGFYFDPSRPWGTNNIIFPNVAMPNVLLPLRGLRIPVYRTESSSMEGQVKNVPLIDHFITVKRGIMTPSEFNNTILDLVNFLVYVSEPHQQERKHLGVWVILFLIAFLVVVYALKREYWKKIR